ncbi:MAG: LamG-like jellyroll fold domain-containing protein, partial [Phycisphaerales bacterium]
MFKKRRNRDGDQSDNRPPQRKPRLDVESLEKRVLMSASWVDADTGDAQSGATEGNDHFTGTDGADIAMGQGGQDLLEGLGGADTLLGGHGDDILRGGDGDDILAGNSGQDTLDGGDGHDIADYSSATGPVQVDVTLDGVAQDTGTDGVDTLTSIEGVVGSDHDDTFAFSQPVDGARYTVDGGGGTNTLDLSGYSSDRVTWSEGEMSVETDTGSFTIEYDRIDSISFADVDAVVAEGGVSGLSVSSPTLVVDGAVAFRVEPTAGTALIDYDATTDTASVSLSGSGSTIDIAAIGSEPGTVNLSVSDTTANITVDGTVGTAAFAGDVFGSLTVNGDVQRIEIGDDLDGGTITVSGSVGEIVLTDDIKNSGHIAIAGDVGTIRAGDLITSNAVVIVDGDLDRIEAGTNIQSGASITASGVRGEVVVVDGATTHTETIDGIGSMAYDGDTLTVTVDLPSPHSLGLGDSDTVNGAITAREPVAHWQFTADGAQDRVASVNGVYAGDATVADADGRAARFDGTDDVVTIPHSDAFELDNGSIEFRFNADDASARQGLFSKDSTNYDDGGHFTVWVDDGRVEVRLQSATQSYTLVSDQVVQSGEWVDVAVQFGESGFKLFVNGQLEAENAYTGGLGATSGGTGNEEPIVLGANAWQSGDLSADNLKEHFSGMIADVAVFEIEPPPPPSAADLGLPATDTTLAEINARNPVAHWSFGDAGVTDLVGDADGDYHGQAGVLDADGRVASFDGSGDYVVLNHTEALELENGSIEFRFNADDASARQGLFSKDSSGYDDGGHVTMWVDDNRVIVRVQSASSSYDLSSDAIVQSGEWTDVALRFGDDGLQLFVNGELADSDPYTGGLGSNSGGTGNTEPIVLGANQWGSGDGVANNLREYFRGEIADVAIYGETAPANTAPFDLVLSGGTVSEDAPIGTLVATASASDADAGDVLSYSLSDDAGGRFSIDPATGAITVAGELDHESSGTHTVRVVATDAAGLSVESDLTITVGDVNESPFDLVLSGGTVSEDAPIG